MKIFEKIRFAIANRLNKSPKYCWANLALFGLGYNIKGNVTSLPGSGEACRKESETHGSNTCYCGKFYCGRLATKEDFKTVCDSVDPTREPF